MNDFTSLGNLHNKVVINLSEGFSSFYDKIIQFIAALIRSLNIINRTSFKDTKNKKLK